MLLRRFVVWSLLQSMAWISSSDRFLLGMYDDAILEVSCRIHDEMEEEELILRQTCLLLYLKENKR